MQNVLGRSLMTSALGSGSKADNRENTYEKHSKYLGLILDDEFTYHKRIEHIALLAEQLVD